jgi:hypothetical protein
MTTRPTFQTATAFAVLTDEGGIQHPGLIVLGYSQTELSN